MQLVGTGRFGPGFCPDCSDGAGIQPANIPGLNRRHPAAVLYRQGTALFERGIIEECIRPGIEYFMRQWRRLFQIPGNELHFLVSDLLQQSLLDPLTGLLNRRGLNEAADRELKRYSRSQQEFAVAVADIDHFKKLNDQHGHAFGDEVLVDFAVICQSELRSYDVFGRSGGEEFLLLLPITSPDAAMTVLERIRKRFEASTPLGSDPNTVSIGVTSTRGRANVTWAQLQKEADKAMYHAKHMGRNRTIVYDAESELAL